MGIWLSLLVGALGCSSGAEAPAFQPWEEVVRSTVFEAGEAGYHTFRIPAMVESFSGSLLAICEGRKEGQGDTGDIDLVMKRSGDGGSNWSSLQLIWDDGQHVVGNPCIIRDEERQMLHLLCTTNLGSDSEREIMLGQSEAGRRVYYLFSEDDGHSWSSPREITASVKDSSWRWYATGPGIGIQVQKGPHAGRLIVPCDHSVDSVLPDSLQLSYKSHIIFSDDGGKTWELGGTVSPLVNECQITEVQDPPGGLLLNMRAYSGRNFRQQALSTDGGMTWSQPADMVSLIEPVCQASLLRYTWADSLHPGLVVFANPASLRRENLMIKYSFDEGNTWPYSQTIFPGPSAYSALARVGGQGLGCLFECGENSPYEAICFVGLKAPKAP
ncbi:MAG: sialidase family protein [Bacteroidota bacterium]